MTWSPGGLCVWGMDQWDLDKADLLQTVKADVSALYGKVDHGEYGLFVSLGRFKHTAKNLERNRSNLRLLDGDDIVQLILTHYESLDPKIPGPDPTEERLRAGRAG